MPYLRTLPDGSLLLTLHVQPRAKNNQLAGLHNDALKIRLTTPPIEGRANRAVIAFISKELHLPKSAISIKKGHQSRIKLILISGCNEENARRILTGKSNEKGNG